MPSKNPKIPSHSVKYIQQNVLATWRRAHPDADVNARAIGEWALRKGLIEPSRKSVVDWAAQLVRRGLQGEHLFDEKGQAVKRNHAIWKDAIVNGEPRQQVIFVDIEKATPKEFRSALAWRRKGVFADFRQMLIDHGYYVVKHPGADVPRPDGDFNKDAAETDLGTTYPAQRPPEDADDDDDGDDDGGQGVLV